MPRPVGKDNYVGIEIECFGPLNMHEIRMKLRTDTSLVGKFDVVNDYSIRPTKKKPKKGDLKLLSGAMSTVKVKYNPRSNRYVSTHRLKEVRGKQGLFYSEKRTTHYKEMKYNGTKWVNVAKHLPATKGYVSGTSYINKKNLSYYKSRKSYFNPDSRYNKYEVRLLIKQKEINSTIKKVYTILNDNGVMVNKSCGLHVHLDARNRNKSILYKNLFQCQDLFKKVNRSRSKGNKWCKTNRYTTYTRQITSEWNRYYIVNPHSYSRHKTIEVRIGEATMDHKEVIAWVRMLTNIADRKSAMKEGIKTTATYLKKFKTSEANKKAIASMTKRKVAA